MSVLVSELCGLVLWAVRFQLPHLFLKHLLSGMEFVLSCVEEISKFLCAHILVVRYVVGFLAPASLERYCLSSNGVSC